MITRSRINLEILAPYNIVDLIPESYLKIRSQLTNFYERPFQPFLGSNIRALLFELVDSVVAASLERQITETITNYEPRVGIQNITAIPSPDENGYNVRMVFFLVNNPNPVTINFFLERIR
jgi:phage baseplate assembly protein W